MQHPSGSVEEGRVKAAAAVFLGLRCYVDCGEALEEVSGVWAGEGHQAPGGKVGEGCRWGERWIHG